MQTGAFQSYLDGLVSGRFRMPLERVFRFEEIRDAHVLMESNRAAGKIVVTLE